MHEAVYVPGDPAITCPSLFKGSHSIPAGIGLAFHNLLCVAALSHKAVLRVLLAVWCYSSGYGIVCLSHGLYGSIFTYYKAGYHVSGCMFTYVYNLTLRGLKNGKNGGEPNGFCLVFVMLKKGCVHF